MPDHTLHAIDGTASNVLGSAVSWGSTGSFTYDEANIQFDTLVFTDNDATSNNHRYQLRTSQIKMVSCKTAIRGSADHGRSLAHTGQVLKFGECLNRRILWKVTCCSRKTWRMG